MRPQFILLLALAAVLTGADASTTTTKAHSIAVDQNDSPAKRMLRSYTTADEGEERGRYGAITKVFKSKKVSTNLELLSPDLVKLAKMKKDLNGAFKYLKLNKITSADDLFTNPAYTTWLSYMVHRNSQSKNEPFTVAKFFNKKLGDEGAAKLFDSAIKSADPQVSRMGQAYGGQLLKEWAQAGKHYDEVARIAPAFAPTYEATLINLARAAQKKTTALAKARVAANAARANARV
ncbi:hypothetical protein PHYPSEUDO_004670 [Phytophthora pseudosyringae]|uniref:RxLR effector protein n=1 Tax=Phytophthora pseudosyringae TaxID=221518 RepID=A0A8T1VR44_9STRA|nr:hypothetical protein PHYPSEUDO_004670 [Phytophthora pseudosyringae]